MGERVAHGEGVEMLQGTLDLLVLKTLSWGPAHGYGIARWIQQVTNDVLRVEEGSLYPALHRLAKRGWVTTSWGVSENNRRARFYELSPRGRAQLRAEAGAWEAFATAVAQVLTSRQRPEWARS